MLQQKLTHLTRHLETIGCLYQPKANLAGRMMYFKHVKFTIYPVSSAGYSISDVLRHPRRLCLPGPQCPRAQQGGASTFPGLSPAIPWLAITPGGMPGGAIHSLLHAAYRSTSPFILHPYMSAGLPFHPEENKRTEVGMKHFTPK